MFKQLIARDIVLAPLVTRPARIAMAPIFIVGGMDALIAPGPKSAKVEAAGLPRATLATRANGAAMMVGGMALAVGPWPRLAAAGLMASLVPTTAVGHAFWAEDTSQGRQAQLLQFCKNLSMLGGLLLALR